MYVKLHSNEKEIKKGPQSLPQSWGGISGFNHLSNEELSEHNWYPFIEGKVPDYDSLTHRVEWSVELVDGVAYSVPKLVELGLALQEERLTLLRDGLKEEVAVRRKAIEKQGVMYNGSLLHSDRETMVGLLFASSDGTSEEWKCLDNTWVMLTSEDMQEAANLIKEHLRACFKEEALISQEIDSMDLAEAKAFDLDEWWSYAG